MKKILITGGAGYIGSHTNKLFYEQGYETIVLDNLVYGHEGFVKWGEFVKGDLNDLELLEQLFVKNDIDLVIHFAAYAYVGESVKEPSKYYRNNVVNTINLLETMRRYNCNKIVFSSTCSTYGVPDVIPITESMPQNPINPYGSSKLMIERIISDYASAYNLQFVILRYFNAAGADPVGEIGEWHEPETHLIPLVLDVAAGIRESIHIYGADYSTKDGSCIRDYIHVSDLAQAHLLSYRYLQKNGANDFFNLGNGSGSSVFEIIEAAEKVTGCVINKKIVSRRLGDPAILIADSTKVKSVLKWSPQYSSIETIIEHAWNWKNIMK